jgi:hypothetical protein
VRAPRGCSAGLFSAGAPCRFNATDAGAAYGVTGGGGLRDLARRIGYKYRRVIGIYRALHMLFSKSLANEWMKRPNDNTILSATPA